MNRVIKFLLGLTTAALTIITVPVALTLLTVDVGLSQSNGLSENPNPTRPKSNSENRTGYTSPVFHYPKGTLQVGDAEVSTVDGLEVASVIYKESPNTLDLKWTQVKLEMRDGTKIIANSIQSFPKRNFISIIQKENPNEVLWLPFEAIKTLSVTNAPPCLLTNLTVVKEAYGRFRITYQNGLKGDSSLQLTASLVYPLPDGRFTIAGILGDGNNTLDVSTWDFSNGTTWKSVPWASVRKCEIVFPNNNIVVDSTQSIPRFVYRTTGGYSDVWLEYRCPDTDHPTDVISASDNIGTPPTNWPSYSSELTGLHEVRVKNPNDFKVRVGLRSDGKGKDFIVSPNGTESVNVPNGRYDIYFNYSSDPSGLYQGDGFTLENNDVEITITKLVNGNYGIRKVK